MVGRETLRVVGKVLYRISGSGKTESMEVRMAESSGNRIFRHHSSRKNSKKGFTLVELIVVLVILAILAAILVPTLLGFIDKAKEKKDINSAKACFDAAQACLIEAYGKKEPVEGNRNVIGLEASKVTEYGDVNAVNSKMAKQIKELTGENPYIFIAATGNCNNATVSEHDRYTVYYACYVRERDSAPYYYYNGEWSKANPTNINVVVKDTKAKSNTLVNGNKKLPIQYYILCNKDNLSYSGLGDNTFWGYLRNVLDKKYN